MPRPTLRERFDARVKWGANDCLIWQGAPNSEGYGLLSIGPRGSAKHLYVHRLAVEWATGKPVPDGMHVDHLCRNRLCVNVEHLEVVTHGENIRRGYEHARRTRTGRYAYLRLVPTEPGRAGVRITRLADETETETTEGAA